jgi:hypothetical protein
MRLLCPDYVGPRKDAPYVIASPSLCEGRGDLGGGTEGTGSGPWPLARTDRQGPAQDAPLASRATGLRGSDMRGRPFGPAWLAGEILRPDCIGTQDDS